VTSTPTDRRRRHPRTLAALTAATLLCGALVAVVEPATKLERTELNVGLITAVDFLPLYVAEELGYFKAEGLKVNLHSFQAGTEITQALLGRAIDVAASAGTDAVLATASGRPIKSIWELNNFVSNFFVSKPSVKSWKDVKGKTLAVSRPGAQSDLILRWVLRKEGYDPDRDVRIIASGGIPERMAALKAGTVDVASLTEPITSAAVRDGFHLLGKLSDYVPSWPNEVLFTFEEFTRRNPETVKAFLRAVSKAARFIPANEPETVRIIMKYVKFNEDNAQLGYRAVRNTFPVTGEFGIAGWDFIQELMIISKEIPQKVSYEKLFDRTFVNWAKETPK
jgi:NitT/TauT family transport system substrate-binding protein